MNGERPRGCLGRVMALKNTEVGFGGLRGGLAEEEAL